MSKKALADLGMMFDVAANCADFTRVNLRKFELLTTSSGHPAIPIVPARPTDGTRRLVLDDSGPKSSEQYMAYAVSSFSRSRKTPTHQTRRSRSLHESNIYHDIILHYHKQCHLRHQGPAL